MIAPSHRFVSDPSNQECTFSSRMDFFHVEKAMAEYQWFKAQKEVALGIVDKMHDILAYSFIKSIAPGSEIRLAA
jgi:hypothetical protein